MKKAIADGHVHAEFQNALDSVAPEQSNTRLASPNSNVGNIPVVVVFTGHLLGGAPAAIAGVELTGRD